MINIYIYIYICLDSIIKIQTKLQRAKYFKKKFLIKPLNWMVLHGGHFSGKSLIWSLKYFGITTNALSSTWSSSMIMTWKVTVINTKSDLGRTIPKENYHRNINNYRFYKVNHIFHQEQKNWHAALLILRYLSFEVEPICV